MGFVIFLKIMLEFFTEFPTISNSSFTTIKKGIDGAFKNFAREYGDSIDAFFDPLLAMLV